MEFKKKKNSISKSLLNKLKKKKKPQINHQLKNKNKMGKLSTLLFFLTYHLPFIFKPYLQQNNCIYLIKENQNNLKFLFDKL